MSLIPNLVTATERAQAVADVQSLIESSGLEGGLFRRSDAPKSRYGEEESEYEDTGITFPFEWRPKPKETLSGDTPDAEIHVLPGLDIREGDRIRHDATDWKVLNVTEENLFGAVTHKLVRLARVY